MDVNLAKKISSSCSHLFPLDRPYNSLKMKYGQIFESGYSIINVQICHPSSSQFAKLLGSGNESQNSGSLHIELHQNVQKEYRNFHSYLHVGPPLRSSGLISWLQIQRSGFDSRRYQIF
jgi:hypothetical protein